MHYLIGIVVLALVVWAILNIAQSSAETGPKVLWILVVLLLGPLGVLIWYFAGPKKA